MLTWLLLQQVENIGGKLEKCRAPPWLPLLLPRNFENPSTQVSCRPIQSDSGDRGQAPVCKALPPIPVCSQSSAALDWRENSAHWQKSPNTKTPFCTLGPTPHQISTREELRTHTLHRKKEWCFLIVDPGQERPRANIVTSSHVTKNFK